MKKKFYDRCRVDTPKSFSLSNIDPDDTTLVDLNKAAAVEQLRKLNQKLDELQELLFAESQRKVLIILQGMDTSGKDGTIREVFEGVNPQGVKVKSFKAPTAEELAHDYLWRVHQATPAKGEMVIFNRSHYEDVLVVRVHDFVEKDVWKKRYDHINDFELMLVDEGVTVLKFFLHISKDEQRERLQERIDDPSKHWKFRVTDLSERKLWDEYQQVYQEMIQKTSTAHAPWYVVPADHKWFRNLVIASTIVDTLENFKMDYPQSPDNLKNIKVV
jgi:PPK2 family polyphosphate:nucleotide phosphotransferase